MMRQYSTLLAVALQAFAFIRRSHATFDIRNDVFMLDGAPLQIISGSVHYFRIPREYWKDRLIRLKHMGLNTIQFYTPWNAHEPSPGHFDFEGNLDVEKFLRVVSDVGLHAIVRPGPYICAEWDAGGLPWWLASSTVSGGGTMKLRSNDTNYLAHVEAFWNILLPKLKPFMHSHGGPILMAQVENEYGFCGSNKDYLHELIRIAKHNLGSTALLFTTDPPWIVQQGSLPGDRIYTVVDFGPQVNADAAFTIQKSMNPIGKTAPFCSEFYTGWLTHWGQPMANTSASQMTDAFKKILRYGNGTGSVNLYMAHGGTNFGFWAGAGLDGDQFLPQITSYDYSAPLGEQGTQGQLGIGGPNKYHMLRDAIHEHTGQQIPAWPKEIPTKAYGTVTLDRKIDLLSAVEYLYPGEGIITDNPLNMEEHGQGHGAILYITVLEPSALANGAKLDLGTVHDFAHVYVDWQLIGTLQRSKPETLQLPKLQSSQPHFLQILVHAMGRDSGGCAFDRKGLLHPVKVNGAVVNHWHTFPLPLNNLGIIPFHKHRGLDQMSPGLPTIYRGEISIDKATALHNGLLPDSFLDLSAWGKGIAYVNGFNLGWYWPSIGPQNHYFVPGPRLRPGKNEIIIVEFEKAADVEQVTLVEHPDLRGPKVSHMAELELDITAEPIS